MGEVPTASLPSPSPCRYYYYLGRIKALQLDYTEGHKHLLQSARKAPQNSAAGFKQHVAKLSVTVDLLLGNIPEQQTFVASEVPGPWDWSSFICTSSQVKQSLSPCLQLTQAVKTGDVGRSAPLLPLLPPHPPHPPHSSSPA